MNTIDLPKRQWTKRLDEFSMKYQGWLVSLDIATPPNGAQREIRQMPLVGVTAESSRDHAISIAVEEPTGQHLTHLIRHPQHIALELTRAGDDAALEIKGRDGEVAILRLRTTH